MKKKKKSIKTFYHSTSESPKQQKVTASVVLGCVQTPSYNRHQTNSRLPHLTVCLTPFCAPSAQGGQRRPGRGGRLWHPGNAPGCGGSPHPRRGGGRVARADTGGTLRAVRALRPTPDPWRAAALRVPLMHVNLANLWETVRAHGRQQQRSLVLGVCRAVLGSQREWKQRLPVSPSLPRTHGLPSSIPQWSGAVVVSVSLH